MDSSFLWPNGHRSVRPTRLGPSGLVFCFYPPHPCFEPCNYQGLPTTPLVSPGTTILQGEFWRSYFQEHWCSWPGRGHLRQQWWSNGSYVTTCSLTPNSCGNWSSCLSACCFLCNWAWSMRFCHWRWFSTSNSSYQRWTTIPILLWPHCGWHSPLNCSATVFYFLSCEMQL